MQWGLNLISSTIRWTLFSLMCLLSAGAIWPFYVVKNFPRLMRSGTYFPLGVALIVVDQISKVWASTVLRIKEDPITLLDGFLELKYVENTGAAFGILKGKTLLFVMMAALTIMIIVVYLSVVDEEEPVVRVALVLILAGAIGNLIDRVVLGYVVDYIHMFHRDRGWEWPVFNFADMIIDIGVVIIVLDFIRDLVREGQAPAEAAKGV